MPISGVVLTCIKGCAGDVAGMIGGIAGVEVHGVLPDDQIVAVLEADSVEGEVSLVTRLHEVDGVAAVRLAYHHFEENDAPRPC